MRELVSHRQHRKPHPRFPTCPFTVKVFNSNFSSVSGKVVSRTRHGNSYKDKKEELTELGFNFNTQAKGTGGSSIHCILYSAVLHCTVLLRTVLCPTRFHCSS